MTVLVTGATGCIGHALVTRLVETGTLGPVRVLVRPESDRESLPSGIEVVSGTLENGAESLIAAVRGADVIFHAAAKVHDPHGSPAEFQRVNVEGTQNLLDACDYEGIHPRLIFYSTVAVYGETTPSEGISEDAPVAPATPYAESKVAAEELVRVWGKTTGAAATIFRVATVYGPRDRGNMARMMAAIARGRFILPGKGNNRKTCVASENVVRASLKAATAPAERVAGRNFVVADPAGPYPLRELAEAMAAALGGKRLPRAIPVSVLRSLAGTLEMMLKERSPLTRAQISRLSANNVYFCPSLGEILEERNAVRLSYGMDSAAAWLKTTPEL